MVFVVASLLVGSAAAQTPAAPPADGRIEGRVVDSLGSPVALADVRVELVAGATVASTRADGDGRFITTRLPLRPLRILATAPAHTTVGGYAQLDALHTVT